MFAFKSSISSSEGLRIYFDANFDYTQRIFELGFTASRYTKLELNKYDRGSTTQGSFDTKLYALHLTDFYNSPQTYKPTSCQYNLSNLQGPVATIAQSQRYSLITLSITPASPTVTIGTIIQ